MAEKIQKGDRVRVAYEGVVDETTPGGAFNFVGSPFFFDAGTAKFREKVNVEIEVLRRHVFPDGTLWVGTSGDSLYKAGKRWVWDSGAPASADDDTVRRYIADGDGKVVYEPPTA